MSLYKERAKTLVAGIIGQAGYRDGDLRNTLFQEPMSIIYFRRDDEAVQRELKKIVIVLANKSEGEDYRSNN